MKKVIKSFKFKVLNANELQKFIHPYIKKFNNIVHFSYNRKLDNPSLEVTNIIKTVKNTMNNIELLDVSTINDACKIGHDLYKSDEKPVQFGGKSLYKKYNSDKINKRDFKQERCLPFHKRGETNKFCNGNRKFELDLANRQIIFKPCRNKKIIFKIQNISNNYLDYLTRLENLCKSKQAYFNCSFDYDSITISTDVKFFKVQNYEKVSNRILSIDLNPHDIAISIADYDKVKRTTIKQERVYEFYKLNTLHKTESYKNCKNKQEYRTYINNKRKYEIFEVVKSIINLAKHYKVESIVVEKLNIAGKNYSKRKLNHTINNSWIRNAFVDNLKYKCSINNILFQDVVCCYSSLIGQLQNGKKTDNVAASLEIGRRGNLYIRSYIKKDLNFSNCNKIDIVYPKFNLESLLDRWKKKVNVELSKLNEQLVSDNDKWKLCYNLLSKNSESSSYRVLFKDNKGKFLNSLENKNSKSYVKIYYNI